MATRDLVVVGASAGGLQPLYTILAALPASLPAAVVIVVHTRSNGGVLPQVLPVEDEEVSADEEVDLNTGDEDLGVETAGEDDDN